jgi:hypothetical protein
MVVVSLAIGIAGYMALEDLAFIDAFVNAAMILSGMGPLHDPQSVAGKVFAGLYAIYSGFAVIGISAVIFAPVVHRIFHRLHIEDLGETGEAEGPPRAKPSRKRPRAG